MRWLGIALALAVAAAWIAFIPNEPFSDQGIYNHRAVALAEGRGYIDDSGDPTAYWAPGYAFYLAFFYLLFAAEPQTAFIANLIAYLLLIAGLYRLGSLAYSPRTGLLAATLAALYPSFIFYNTVIASEILFSALAAWAMALCWEGFDREGKKRVPLLVLGGLLLGAAALVRPVALILPLALFAIGSARRAPFYASLWRFLLVSLLMIGACLPWGMRNQKELGSFVLVSANSGANLWIGNHKGAGGGYTHLDPILDREKLREMPLVERDRFLREKALKFIQKNPGEFFRLMGNRIAITFKSESIAAVWNKIGLEKRFGANGVFYFKILANLAYFTLLLFFLFYLYHSFKKRQFHRSDRFLFTMLFLLSLPFLIFIGQDRFHLPLIPYLMLFVSKSFLMRLPRHQRP